MSASTARPAPLVLLVDDDPEVLEVLEECVTALGYLAATATSGAAGVARVRGGPVPDAVLLDITMPGMNGLQALHAIKAHHPDLPVIMVTANVDIEIARATLHDGAFDYVTKPVEIERLRDVLTAALALSGRLPPA